MKKILTKFILFAVALICSVNLNAQGVNWETAPLDQVIAKAKKTDKLVLKRMKTGKLFARNMA